MISILFLQPEGLNFHPLANAEGVDLPLVRTIICFAFKKISQYMLRVSKLDDSEEGLLKQDSFNF